jgi:hypothetical protein
MMLRLSRSGLAVAVAAAVAGLLVARVASVGAGEIIVDAYAGAPFPQSGSRDGVITAGARFGYGIDFTDIIDGALFLDGSAIIEDLGSVDPANLFTSGVDYRHMPFTLLPMVRFSLLTSENNPNGILQPYLALGPSLVWGQIDGFNFSDDEIAIGGDGRVGMYIMPIADVGIFAEYRYTYADFTFGTVRTGGGRVSVSPEESTHHALFGASFRF